MLKTAWNDTIGQHVIWSTLQRSELIVLQSYTLSLGMFLSAVQFEESSVLRQGFVGPFAKGAFHDL